MRHYLDRYTHRLLHIYSLRFRNVRRNGNMWQNAIYNKKYIDIYVNKAICRQIDIGGIYAIP